MKPAISIILLLVNYNLIVGQLIFNGGHSHNDYYQAQPLLDALNANMVSIEADVFYHKNNLLVGHDFQELTVERSLENLYLKSLFNIFRKNNGNMRPIILMIDIKKNGEQCYNKLKEIIAPYHPMLSNYNSGVIKKGPVTIIISGSRPIKTIKQENIRYVFVDGRIKDLNNNTDTSLMPLISDSWFNHFEWDGTEAIKKDEYNKLKDIVAKCHKENKMIRFWGIPNKDNKTEIHFWNLFHNLKINLIGSDDPQKYHEFELNKMKCSNK